MFTAQRQGHRVRRLPAAPTSKAATIPAAELGDQETLLPACRSGDSSRRRRTAGGAARRSRRLDPKGHETSPPAALHGSVARQEARGGGHRPAVDLRADHRDHPAARLRVPAGQGARAELHGVRRDEAAARPLRRLRRPRLHRGDGGDPRRDLERRARTGSTSCASSTSAAASEGPGLKTDGRGSGEDVSYPVVRRRRRPAQRRRRSSCGSAASGRSCSAARAATGNTASLPDDVAPADLTVEKAVELLDAKAEGPRTLGDRPADRPARLPDDRPLRPLRAARRDAREAAARRSRRARRCRRASPRRRSRSTARCSCCRCRAWSGRHPDDGQPIVAELRALRPVREARRRVPLARDRRRRVRDHARRGRRAAAAAEAVARAAHGRQDGAARNWARTRRAARR